VTRIEFVHQKPPTSPTCYARVTVEEPGFCSTQSGNGECPLAMLSDAYGRLRIAHPCFRRKWWRDVARSRRNVNRQQHLARVRANVEARRASE
jgi:hypothetical protein